MLMYIAVLNENKIGVAGAPPPSLVLGNLCSLNFSREKRHGVGLDIAQISMR